MNLAGLQNLTVQHGLEEWILDFRRKETDRGINRTLQRNRTAAGRYVPTDETRSNSKYRGCF